MWYWGLNSLIKIFIGLILRLIFHAISRPNSRVCLSSWRDFGIPARSNRFAREFLCELAMSNHFKFPIVLWNNECSDAPRHYGKLKNNYMMLLCIATEAVIQMGASALLCIEIGELIHLLCTKLNFVCIWNWSIWI